MDKNNKIKVKNIVSIVFTEFYKYQKNKEKMMKEHILPNFSILIVQFFGTCSFYGQHCLSYFW